MKRLILSLFTVVLFASPRVALAYDLESHGEMSADAALDSVLQQGSKVLPDLGLKSLSDKQQTFPNSKGQPRTILELIQDGATFEDHGIRARHHFYDPVDNQPLTVDGIPLGHTSPDWALEDRDTYLFQNDSFRSAHQFFLDALTKQASNERDKAFGRTFQALGQVIHHLQDMAQPQHTRNDVHLDLFGEFIDLPLVESPSL